MLNVKIWFSRTLYVKVLFKKKSAQVYERTTRNYLNCSKTAGNHENYSNRSLQD